MQLSHEQAYAPPPQQAYAQPPPQQAYAPPPQQAYAPPPQQGYAQPPQQGYAQPPAQGYSPQPMPSGPSMRPHPLIMQQRITRLTGHMVVAPTRLFFICSSNKGGLRAAIGKGIGRSVGGLVGGLAGAIVEGSAAQAHGNVETVYDEPTLYRAVQDNEGSLVMEPSQIKQIKDTFWTHAIWFDGKTYALPNGLDKELKHELGLWCQHNNVKHAGLLPK